MAGDKAEVDDKAVKPGDHQRLAVPLGLLPALDPGPPVPDVGWRQRVEYQAFERGPYTRPANCFLGVLEQASKSVLGEFVRNVSSVSVDFVVEADVRAGCAVIVAFEALGGLAVFRFE